MTALSVPQGASRFCPKGVTNPPSIPSSFRPTVGTSPPFGQPFRVVAVGDGEDDGPFPEQVAQLIGTLSLSLFVYLGDLYDRGTYTEFLNHCRDTGAIFAAYRPATNPIIGTHE